MTGGSPMVLVVAEHDRGALSTATLEALTAARSLATALGAAVHALTIGSAADHLASDLADYGATAVHQAHHDLLADYGPEAWGAVVAAFISTHAPAAVLATGTDRGNEVLAHAAARADLPFAANCLSFEPGTPWTVTRTRWGGSLLEDSAVTATVLIASVTHHGVEAVAIESPPTPDIVAFTSELDPSVARTIICDRVERVAGITLATAPVVVSGGRGVGSAEAFAPLEDLAALLGGVVGCSRAVTNNGWRNHTDQVGQTGTRIAPEIYFACGISGATQHWVGAMASKKILAINTDPDANMVTKADYAVIGDLHEIVPAIAMEIRRRQT